ncbi:MAG: redoxin domain-containing protein, partial [Waddliaceae bacterium]
KNKLQFSLLSDVKKDMCKKFGVLKGDKVIRSTFVVNARGVIRWIEKPVDVKGHVARVLKALEKHCHNDLFRYRSFEADYADILRGK